MIPIKYHLILLNILNLLHRDGVYPETWSDTYLHFIPKASGRGLRPLALTYCICKLYEIMLANRLRWWIETTGVLPDDQLGFRKGLSCTGSLAVFKLDINKAFRAREQVLAVYLDISNALSEVRGDIMLRKLASIGCSTKVVNFVRFLTYKRIVYIEINPDQHMVCGKGLPQGGVLSPLLYVIFVADIARGLDSLVRVLQYADDTVVYLRSPDPAQDRHLLEEALDAITQRFHNIRLEVSAEKTEFIQFNNGRIQPGSSEIRVWNSVISSVEVVKFLGFFFYYALTFDFHIRHVLRKALRTLNIVKFIRGVYWGADPATLIAFDKSFRRSVIDYGSFVYFPTQQSRLVKLERVQFSAIRLSLGLRVSTPINILLAEA